MIALKGYLEAAQKRVVEFGEELARVGITVPDIFKIMVRDLDDAGKALPSHAVAERADVAHRG